MPVLSDKSVVCPLLVGRAAFVETLRELLAQVHAGEGRLALISGEAGIGKSRLVAEARGRASALGFLVLEGHCFEPDRTFPYAPLLDLLRRFIAARSSDELARDLGPPAYDLVKLLPEFGELLPEPLASSGQVPGPTRRLDAESEKRRLFHALAQFLLRLAAPLLVVVEDLHWSDDTSLEFLLYLVRQFAGQPILLLLTYRNDQTAPSLTRFLAELDRRRLETELVLPPLTREQVDAMLRAIFDLLRPVRAEFLDALYQLTEGNPFFVEEVLKSLMATGEIFYQDGAWNRKGVDELHIPRSLQDAVLRRSERLSEAARSVLALAAVMGRRFDFGLLQQLAKMSEPELLHVMKDLVAAQLVVEESADQFAFRHALTREAVYASLLLRERRRYHGAVAETLEHSYTRSRQAPSQDRREESVAIVGTRSVEPSVEVLAGLAYHFYEAGVWEKALTYSQQAGEQAQREYAPRVASEYFTRALKAAQQLSLPLPSRLLRARGQAYEMLGDFEKARADYEQAGDAAREAQEDALRWQSLIDLGFLWASRDYAKTGECFRQALAVARASGERALIAHSLNRIGNWHVNVEEPFEARHYHQEALAMFREMDDKSGIAQTLDLLGLASFNCSDLIGGEEYYQQAIALFRELDDRVGLVSSLAMMPMRGGDYTTNTAVAVANLNQVTSEGEEALQIARAIGWRSGEAFALTALAYTLGAQGDYGRALDAARRACEIAEEIEHREWLIRARAALAAIYLDLFALPEAHQQLEQAERLARELGSLLWDRLIASSIASAALLANDLTRAESVLEPVLGVEAASQTVGARQCWCARAELAHAEGDDELALDIVERLIVSAPNVGAGRVIPRLWKLRGEARAGQRNFAQAETDLVAAARAATGQAARPLVWRIHLALGRVYQANARRAEAEREFSAARAIIEGLAGSIPESGPRGRFLERATAALPRPHVLTPRRATKQEFGGLTERERQVAALIAQGKSNREIADALVLSEYTAATHVRNILNKLGFVSRVQIAAWAMEKGLAKPGA